MAQKTRPTTAKKKRMRKWNQILRQIKFIIVFANAKKVLQYAKKTEPQLSSRDNYPLYQVPVNQISKWKNQAKEKMHQSFERSNAVDHEQREQQQLIERLYGQIGKLQVEQDWLKKNFDL